MLAIRGGEAELCDVLCLASAEPPWAPAVVVDAIAGLFASEHDFQNGGADQFVWNSGAAAARAVGGAWRAVGAVENGELLIELAEALERFETEGGCESADPVRAFLAYRRRVGGPFFGRPEPADELAEALVEWALEHPDAFDTPLNSATRGAGTLARDSPEFADVAATFDEACSDARAGSTEIELAVQACEVAA